LKPCPSATSQCARSAIRWRVHVNGIRGKSTTTRYLAAIFREQGHRTFAKTTGSAARILLPDGSEQSVPRQGMANVNEQVGILRQFSADGAEAAIVECMAINPAYGEWLEQKVMQSNLGVITNIRLDHTDYLGETLEAIAHSLARAIPHNGILITAEQNPTLQTWRLLDPTVFPSLAARALVEIASAQEPRRAD
jgi:poly-gamma-glutamate synthase PgsB/CapB